MNPDNSNLNVVLYTRVSTEDQVKEGFSLESQLERLRAFSLARMWNIVGEYIDAGYSGRNTRRPEYQKMLKDAPQWDGILVIKMDRIHRNRSNFIDMMEELKKQEKQFISMSESLDTTTAMGRFVMGIIQDIAQLESEQLGERTFLGMRQKAKKIDSGFMGHGIPFGYQKDDGGQFIEVPEEIQIIKKTFQLYDQGLSMNPISKKLNQKLYNIRYWLSNTWYVGYEQWLNHFKKALVEPVISVELWNRVQQMKVSKSCGSAKHKPFLIKEGIDSFDLSHREMDEMKAWHHRPKHNLEY